MINKIIAFILVYILTVFNFFVFLSPLTFVVLGRLLFNVSTGVNYIKTIFFLSICLINLLMLIFLFFDFLTSYSVIETKRGCKNCQKFKEYNAIANLFLSVKEKYNIKNVKLYISQSSEVNAYAVGGLRKNAIILTIGLLDKYRSNIKDDNLYFLSIKGIISHEMSHIVNNDYFTALFLIINQRAVNFISKLLLLVFNIFVKIFSVIPFIGNYISNLIIIIYNIFNRFIHFSYNYIVMPIYNFIQLQISKNIEYRADKQAAMVVGGKAMSYALSILGNNGYFSIFSTHPLTKDRMNNVKNVETKERVKSVFFSKFLLFLSFFMMIYLCHISYKIANISAVIYDYNMIILYINNKFILIKSYINNFTKI